MKKILTVAIGFLASLALRQSCAAEFQDQFEMVRTAAADLSAKQYVIVAGNATALQMVQATDPTSSLILGVLQTIPKSGEVGVVGYLGMTKVQVGGGVVAADTIITTNTSGRAVAVASGQMACGRLIEAAAAEGDLCTAILFHPVRWTGLA